MQLDIFLVLIAAVFECPQELALTIARSFKVVGKLNKPLVWFDFAPNVSSHH